MIEEVDKDTKAELITFINNHWKTNHIFNRDVRVFNLQHKRNDNEYTFLISRNDESQIDSILGYIETNDSGKSFWLAIWKSISQTGSGLALLNYAIKKKPEFIGSISISEQAKRLYKIFKWNLGVTNHFYLNLNDSNKLRVYKETTEQAEYSILPKLKDDHIDWNQNLLPRKDLRYYKKRYINHPYFDYILVEIKTLKLIFIGRIIYYLNQKVFHVVDCIGDFHEKSISKHLHKFMIDNSIDLFELKYYDSLDISVDLFLKKNDEIIPTYFNPFLYENINIEVAYKADANKRVRFFLGDSDQDRPN